MTEFFSSHGFVTYHDYGTVPHVAYGDAGGALQPARTIAPGSLRMPNVGAAPSSFQQPHAPILRDIGPAVSPRDTGSRSTPIRDNGPIQQPRGTPMVPGSTGSVVGSYSPRPAPAYLPPSEASLYNTIQANAPVGIPASKWTTQQMFTGVYTPSQWLQNYKEQGGSAAQAQQALETNYATPQNPYTVLVNWVQNAIAAVFG